MNGLKIEKGTLQVAKLLLLQLLVSSTLSCNTQKEGRFVSGKHTNTVDMSQIGGDKKFNWKAVIDDIQIIPLETSDKSLVSRIDRLEYSPELGFFIMDCRSRPSLMSFDSNGKFRFKLIPGKGPGEFNEIRSFQLTKKSVDVLERYDVFHYDANGVFVSRTRIGGQDFLNTYSNPTDFVYAENNVYIWTGSLGVRNFKQNDVFAMYSLSKDKNVEKYFRLNNGIMGGMRFYKTKENTLIVPPITSDTIFAISSQGVFPKYYIDFGSNALSIKVENEQSEMEILADLNEFSSDVRSIYPALITEVNDNLFFHYQNGANKLGMALWNKYSGIMEYGNKSLPMTVLCGFDKGLICSVESLYLKDVLGILGFINDYPNLNNSEYDNPYLIFIKIKQ